MPVRLWIPLGVLFLLPVAASAQGVVPAAPPVPARPPVTAQSPAAGAVASDARKAPPEKIAAPDTGTAGPGLGGGAAGAPLSGAATQRPVKPHS